MILQLRLPEITSILPELRLDTNANNLILNPGILTADDKSKLCELGLVRKVTRGAAHLQYHLTGIAVIVVRELRNQ